MVMGSGEVTAPVKVSATVGLQKRIYFEMRYAVMFDDGQTVQVHVTEKIANRLGVVDTVNETVRLRRFEGGGSSGPRKEGSSTDFTLAVSRTKELKTFFPVRVLGKLAETCDRVKKGTKVLVEDKLDTSEYTYEEGQKKMTFRVLADTYRLLSKTKKASSKAKKTKGKS